MFNFRVEAEVDPVSGKHRAKLFYPADSTGPVAITPAMFDSDGEAVEHMESFFRGEFESAEGPDAV